MMERYVIAFVVAYILLALLTYHAIRPYRKGVLNTSMFFIVLISPIAEIAVVLLSLPGIYHTRMRRWAFVRKMKIDAREQLEKTKEEMRNRKLRIVED